MGPSASERAYRHILHGILNGEYPAGSMLAETPLAAEIGVSRTPVRAALVRLQDDGWLTIYPKRGALVRGLSERAVADLADARLVLESTSMRRVGAEGRADLAGRLEGLLDQQREELARGDLAAFIESSIVFHRAFVEAGGNVVLLELNDRLADRQRFLLISHGEELLARGESVVEEHAQMVSLLRAGDAAGFADVLREHIGDTYGLDLAPLAPGAGSLDWVR